MVEVQTPHTVRYPSRSVLLDARKASCGAGRTMQLPGLSNETLILQRSAGNGTSSCESSLQSN